MKESYFNQSLGPALFATALCAATTGVGCNSFQSMDTPSGDIQLLSAARACFDRGDYDCASKYYGRLSSASSDQGNSESAFQILAQNGMTAPTFMDAVVKSGANAGKLVTHLAGSLTDTAGETLRLSFFHAYQKAALINDSRSQGLVLFITSLTLLAEILAEDASTSGRLKATDLVDNPTTCNQTQGIGLTTGCEPPASDIFVDGLPRFSLTTATDVTMSGTPTLTMVDAALKEVLRGVNQIGASASLGTASGSFAQELVDAAGTAIGTPAGSPIYRYTLIKLNIGNSS